MIEPNGTCKRKKLSFEISRVSSCCSGLAARKVRRTRSVVKMGNERAATTRAWCAAGLSSRVTAENLVRVSNGIQLAPKASGSPTIRAMLLDREELFRIDRTPRRHHARCLRAWTWHEQISRKSLLALHMASARSRFIWLRACGKRWTTFPGTAINSLIADEILSAHSAHRMAESGKYSAKLIVMTVDRRRFLALTAAATLAPSALATAARTHASRAGGHMLQMNGYAVDAETPLELLTDYLTPNELFFVRSPWIPPPPDPKTWRLLIDGDVESPTTFSLADLRALRVTKVTCVLQCAGNA